MNIKKRYIKKRNMLIKDVDNNFVVFEPMTKTYNILNGMAKDILNNCDGNKDISDLITFIKKVYNNNNLDEIKRDVFECIEAMIKLGLIEENVS